MIHSNEQDIVINPPGLLGGIAQFFFDSSPRQVEIISQAGAISYLSGLAGRSFNVSNTGLNQYSLLAAPTGSGKDAVASGVARLNAAIAKTCPSIVDFKGPGEMVSSAGLIKWMAKHPSCLVIVGEIFLKFREMAKPNNSNGQSLTRALLQLYSKSGNGETFDPIAYSDTDKNTPTLNSPSLTMFGEGTNEGFYETFTEAVISNGLFPRCLVEEYTGKRPPLNEGFADVVPPDDLVEKLANLVAICAANHNQGKATQVRLDETAKSEFSEFDRHTTDLINNTNGEIQRQLWNRAHLKALKLAAVAQVGINPYDPVIGLDAAHWSIRLVTRQTDALIRRFQSGEVGEEAGNQAKQRNHVIRVITEWVSQPYGTTGTYEQTKPMHSAHIVTLNYIKSRLRQNKAFMPNIHLSIENTVKDLIQSDDLRTAPHKFMLDHFDTAPVAYQVYRKAMFGLPEGQYFKNH